MGAVSNRRECRQMSRSKTDSMEEPSGDDENSACIGEDKAPEVTSAVQADVNHGPESDQVYGSRW